MMKNFFSGISRRDFLFISLILIVLLAMIFLDTSVDILVDIEDTVLQITSPRLNVDIEHSHVVSVELIDMPAFGTKVGDSYEHERYCAGTWNNNDWGAYTLCVIPTNSKCVLVEVENDGFVVFSCTTDEKTEKLFDDYCAYFENLAA